MVEQPYTDVPPADGSTGHVEDTEGPGDTDEPTDDPGDTDEPMDEPGDTDEPTDDPGAGPWDEGPERIDIPALHDVRDDILPLLPLGDVNEDGIVDGHDVLALHAFVEDDDASAMTCQAVADIDQDGELTIDDAVMLADWVVMGPLMAPALDVDLSLPCGYDQLTLAASAEILEGEPVRLRLVGEAAELPAEISVDVPAEVVPAEDGAGWDIYTDGLGLDSMTVDVFIGDSYFLYTLQSAPAEEPTEEFIWVGDDPRDTPPPRIYGEEVDDLEVCPNEDKGCQALVIDLIKKNDLIIADADSTAGSLARIECEVTYVAPKFRRIPRARTIVHANGTEQKIPPPPERVAEAKAMNRKAWTEVQDAIMTHRTNLAEGAELAYQLVAAHGGRSIGCGYWSPGYGTGVGMFLRSDFHRDNYLWASGNVCHAVAEDRSCYGGHTPQALDALNNTGQVSCSNDAVDHSYHAGFYTDSAISPGPAEDVAYNGEVLLQDWGISSMIYSEGRLGDYGKVGWGFRQEAGSADSDLTGLETEGRYGDRGHNHRPGSHCDDASHSGS